MEAPKENTNNRTNNERDKQDHPGTDDVRKDNSDKIDQTGPPNKSDSSVKVEPGTENSHIMGTAPHKEVISKTLHILAR